MKSLLLCYSCLMRHYVLIIFHCIGRKLQELDYQRALELGWSEGGGNKAKVVSSSLTEAHSIHFCISPIYIRDWGH